MNLTTIADATAPAGTCELPGEAGTEFDYRHLKGKRVGIVVLSTYPRDPRPRRTADALLRQGMNVDYICVTDGKTPWHEKNKGMNLFRIPMEHQRGGKFSYAYQYSAFIAASAVILALRSCAPRYDLIYVNNMPDVLIVSALLPKIFGAKVILDLHDPMPELMMTIFDKGPDSKSVQVLRFLEKWSIARADQVLVPDEAFRRLVAARTPLATRIAVVMNSPDESIFPFRAACSRPALNPDSKKAVIVMYHGTLVERNGLDLAIDAIASLRERLPGAQLHIYGKATAFFERVMQSAKERGLEHNVLYLGEKSLEQIVEAIDASDAGVIPNRRNAFTDLNMPTRIFEYLARGKPTIAPRTAGIQDYFDEDSLLFFEPGNADDLAGRIEFAALHPGETLNITERGQRVYKAHTWSRERETLVRVVAKLLESQH